MGLCGPLTLEGRKLLRSMSSNNDTRDNSTRPATPVTDGCPMAVGIKGQRLAVTRWRSVVTNKASLVITGA